ncbi:hypothetical protein [Gordonia sp. (in: high G+C Gram-positive bacteria)]|uniref:hypothetical protein n=1 Tax=Gordonia sp. (in: high G+C Gram-positive bacteria) TaxID=84139 RepID=UPI003C74F99D
MHIVYLHGVGNGDPEMTWFEGLNRGLAAIGAKTVDEANVVAPRYSSLLRVPSLKSTHPAVTYTEKNDRDARRAFERRQGQVELKIRDLEDVRSFGLGKLSDSVVNGLQEPLIEAAPLEVLAQVKNYLDDEGLRGAVLQRILDRLPDTDQIVLIGHSLGSVVAIDLLDHLPTTMRVRRFITIGSPAGSPVLHRNSNRILKRFPYSRVDDWSNFLDPLDGVTAGRGLASLFPGAQDFWLKGAQTHDSSKYLENRAVASLIDTVVNPGTAIVPASGDVVRRLTDAEVTVLVTLEFANAVGDHIPKKQVDTRERFDDALSVVRDLYIAELTAQSDLGQLPPELQTLVDGRLPTLPRVWDLSDAIRHVVVLAYSNAVAPYEIDTGEASIDAISSVMRQLGYSSGIASKVQDAVRSVDAHLEDRRRTLGTKSRWAMAAAGVALLAAAPVGLVLAGAAGTVGAAAITSGLAAFGPGGMVGGLAIAGGLAGTGGMVTAAAATAKPGVNTVVLDPTSIAIQVAIAHSLKSVGEPFDAGLWERVMIAESELSAQINRLSPFSDPKSPTLERLAAGRDLISSLLDYMRKHGLVPASVLPALSDPARDDEDSDSDSGGFNIGRLFGR